MEKIILNTKNQFKFNTDLKVEGNFKNIVVCGLGGSALPANILRTLLPDLSIPVFSHRDYSLPSIADKDSLIVCISYSGNTEETISAFKEAKEKNYTVIAITTGGELEQLAEQKVIIPKDAVQPRFATGYLVTAFLKVLYNSGIISELPSGNLNAEEYKEQGKKLAKKLVDKIPVIYSTNKFKDLALIWKIKFNENSKIMAFWNYFPELNHNEMVGLTNMKGSFYFLILKDEDDHERNKKRMELFKELAEQRGAEVDIIEIKGNNLFEKVFNSLILSDWISYFLALEYGRDPIPVEIVEEFKKKLK